MMSLMCYVRKQLFARLFAGVVPIRQEGNEERKRRPEITKYTRKMKYRAGIFKRMALLKSVDKFMRRG